MGPRPEWVQGSQFWTWTKVEPCIHFITLLDILNAEDWKIAETCQLLIFACRIDIHNSMSDVLFELLGVKWMADTSWHLFHNVLITGTKRYHDIYKYVYNNIIDSAYHPYVTTLRIELHLTYFAFTFQKIKCLIFKYYSQVSMITQLNCYAFVAIICI